MLILNNTKKTKNDDDDDDGDNDGDDDGGGDGDGDQRLNLEERLAENNWKQFGKNSIDVLHHNPQPV